MNTSRRRLLQGIAASVPAGIFARAAFAQQQFPTRPIKILVPFGPGSGSDVYARYFAEKLATRLGQAVIVENRPGAGGAIAVRATTEAAADGYTILLGSNSPMAVNVSAYKELPYDPQTDIVPICGLTRSMAVIVVPESSSIKTVDDLIARGKESPMLNMGTYSAGYQLAAAPFLQQAGFNWQNVSYKGLTQTTSDVIGAQLDVAVVDTPSTVRIAQSGKIRAIAVTGTRRHPELPDVPTLSEKGYPAAVHYSWTSLWVKAGTLAGVVKTLSDNLLAILAEPESRKFVEKSSGEIMPFSPAEMREFQKSEITRFAEAVKALNFKPV